MAAAEVRVVVQQLGLGWCIQCVGERLVAEQAARKAHPDMPEFDKWYEPVVWQPPEKFVYEDHDHSETTPCVRTCSGFHKPKLEIPPVTLDEVYPAVTLAPQFLSHNVSVGIGQVQQIWGVVASPVCRQKHIAAVSGLVAG